MSVSARYWLVALGLFSSAGCAKLNPAFQDAEGGTGSDGDSASGSGGGSKTGNTSAGTANSASGGTTTPESDSDHSTTKLATGSESGSGTGTGETSSSDSGVTRPPWTDECAFFGPLEPCSAVAGSVQGFSCTLGFTNVLEPGCGKDFVSRIQVVLDEGTYVIGAIGFPEAEYAAFQSDAEVLDCSPDNPVFEVDSGVQAFVELEVWYPLPTTFPLRLRRVDSLCQVADNCCDPSGAPASVACDNEGLRECVLAADPLCDEVWDFICTDQAMFVCGGDCT